MPKNPAYKTFWKNIKDEKGNRVKVFYVNGTSMRKKHRDFTQGGHNLAREDLKFIPDNTIYIERMLNEREHDAILLHEITEYNDMKYHKKSYEKAHEKANKKEHELRTSEKFKKGGEVEKDNKNQNNSYNREENIIFTKNITKDEIQHIISGESKIGDGSLIKTTADYLRESIISDSENSFTEEQKSYETEKLKTYIAENNLWFSDSKLGVFLDRGAEQKVYFCNDNYVIKVANTHYYSSWMDYFYSLLLHNYFFPDTAYELIGFIQDYNLLFSVVKQKFVESTQKTNIDYLKIFMSKNGFTNIKNNDYYNPELNIILEDLHDENVLTNKDIFQFVDTVFYIRNIQERGEEFNPDKISQTNNSNNNDMVVDKYIKELMNQADDRMVWAIWDRVINKKMDFDKAVKDALKKNREGIIDERKQSIINKAIELLKEHGVTINKDNPDMKENKAIELIDKYAKISADEFDGNADFYKKGFINLVEIIDNKDYLKLKDRLWYENKLSKRFFTEYTGVSLAKTDKDTFAILKEFTRYVEPEKEPEKPKMSKDEVKDKMSKAKADAVLSKKINYTDYGILTRAEFMKKVLADGGRLEVGEVDAIKDVSRRTYNRMGWKEQIDFENKKKNAGKKPEYRIYTKDNTFYVITKTEYDYGLSLSGKQTTQSNDNNIENKKDTQMENKGLKVGDIVYLSSNNKMTVEVIRVGKTKATVKTDKSLQYDFAIDKLVKASQEDINKHLEKVLNKEYLLKDPRYKPEVKETKDQTPEENLKPFIAFYKDKRYELYAKDMYNAQKNALEYFEKNKGKSRAKINGWDISIHLADDSEDKAKAEPKFKEGDEVEVISTGEKVTIENVGAWDEKEKQYRLLWSNDGVGYENELRPIESKKEPTAKYRAEVTGTNENIWSGNAIEYDTVEEAEKYLDNLRVKWFGYDMARIVPVTTPTGETVNFETDIMYQNFRNKNNNIEYKRELIENNAKVSAFVKKYNGDSIPDEDVQNLAKELNISSQDLYWMIANLLDEEEISKEKEDQEARNVDEYKTIKTGQRYYDNRYSDYFEVKSIEMLPDGKDARATQVYDKGATRTEMVTGIEYNISQGQYSIDISSKTAMNKFKVGDNVKLEKTLATFKEIFNKGLKCEVTDISGDGNLWLKSEDGRELGWVSTENVSMVNNSSNKHAESITDTEGDYDVYFNRYSAMSKSEFELNWNKFYKEHYQAGTLTYNKSNNRFKAVVDVAIDKGIITDRTPNKEHAESNKPNIDDVKKRINELKGNYEFVSPYHKTKKMLPFNIVGYSGDDNYPVSVYTVEYRGWTPNYRYDNYKLESVEAHINSGKMTKVGAKDEYQQEVERQKEQGIIKDDTEGISIMGMMQGKDNPIDKLKKEPVQTDKKTFYKGTDPKIYSNPYLRNRAIEELLESRSDNAFSSDEVQFLALYDGYGGLTEQVKEDTSRTWKELISEFYTPDAIIQKMWALAYKFGFKDGDTVIETSCATGRFFKYLPDNSVAFGYEMSKYSSRIAQILYPKVVVKCQRFEQLFIKRNTSIRGNINDVVKGDLLIGNPPYGEVGGEFMGMGEEKYTHTKNWIDYFINRGLDMLHKNGLLIYIIGTPVQVGGTLWLDQGMNKAKEMIVAKSDLLDAYWLPMGVFDRTEVVSDIIVLRKK